MLQNGWLIAKDLTPIGDGCISHRFARGLRGLASLGAVLYLNPEIRAESLPRFEQLRIRIISSKSGISFLYYPQILPTVAWIYCGLSAPHSRGDGSW